MKPRGLPGPSVGRQGHLWFESCLIEIYIYHMLYMSRCQDAHDIINPFFLSAFIIIVHNTIMSDEERTAKTQAAEVRAAKRLQKQAETLKEQMEEQSGNAAMIQAEKQSAEERQAFLGYGCLDIFKYEWQQGPNTRAVIPRERDKLVESFVKHGRKWWESENMIPVVLPRDSVNPATLTMDTPDPAKPVQFNQKLQLRYLGGGHRMAALDKMRASMKSKLQVAQEILRDQHTIPDDQKKELEKEIADYEATLPNLGLWAIKFYDEGE